MPSTLSLDEELKKTRYSRKMNGAKNATPSYRIFGNALKSALGPQKSRKAKSAIESFKEYGNYKNFCVDVSPERSTTESISPVTEESKSLGFISKSVIPVIEGQSYSKEFKNELENTHGKHHEYVQQNASCKSSEDTLRPTNNEWPCFSSIQNTDEAIWPNFTSTHNNGSPNSISESCTDHRIPSIDESFDREMDEYRLPLTFEMFDRSTGSSPKPSTDVDYLMPSSNNVPIVGADLYSLPLTVERPSMDFDYYSSPFTSDKINSNIKNYSPHLTPDRTNADADYTLYLNSDGPNMNADDYRLPIMLKSPIIGVDNFEVPFTSVTSDVEKGKCKFPFNSNGFASVKKQHNVFPIDGDSTTSVSMKFNLPVITPQLSSVLRHQVDNNSADGSSGYFTSPFDSDSSSQNSPDQMSYYHMMSSMHTSSISPVIQPDNFSPSDNVPESTQVELTAYERPQYNMQLETRSTYPTPLSHTVNQSKDYSTSPSPGFYSEKNNTNFQGNHCVFPQKAEVDTDELATDQKSRSSSIYSFQPVHNNLLDGAEFKISCTESHKVNLVADKQKMNISMSPNHGIICPKLGNTGLQNGHSIYLEKDGDENGVNDVNLLKCRSSPLNDVSRSLHDDEVIKIKSYSENKKCQVDKGLFNEADKQHRQSQSNRTLSIKLTHSRNSFSPTYKGNEVSLLAVQGSGSESSSCKSCEVVQERYKSADREKRQWNSLPDYCSSTLMTLKSKTGFFDSHCHLDFLFNRQQYAGTYADYQSKHKESYPDSYQGCIAVFCKPFTFYKKFMWQKYLAEDNVWGAFGCHPHEAADYDDKIEECLKIALMHPKVRALGEIGLDYSDRNNCSKEIQHQVLRRQLKIAMDRQLRLVIHCRNANEDCISILQEFLPKDYTFHLHCFTDSWAWAEKWMKAFPNVYIGITNLVTYNSAKPTHEVARRIPLNRLLLETDAPYFVPRLSPPNTKYSHPGMAIYVAAQIAALREVPTDEVLQWTYRNTKFVYNI